MFYACFTMIGSWEGRKNFRVGTFFRSYVVQKHSKMFLRVKYFSPYRSRTLDLGKHMNYQSGS